jgi:ribosomal protein S24E
MENFKILKEKENPLFNRKEIQASVEAEITPTNVDVKKLISEKFSAQIENIKIKNILGRFGSKTFTITANIYSSKEDKDNIEPKSKKEAEAEKKIAEVVKVDEVSEEKPVEETPEENKTIEN